MNSDEYKKLIKSRMSDYRYTHSVNVSKEAVRLAKNTVQILKKQPLQAYCTTLPKKHLKKNSCKL